MITWEMLSVRTWDRICNRSWVSVSESAEPPCSANSSSKRISTIALRIVVVNFCMQKSVSPLAPSGATRQKRPEKLIQISNWFVQKTPCKSEQIWTGATLQKTPVNEKCCQLHNDVQNLLSENFRDVCTMFVVVCKGKENQSNQAVNYAEIVSEDKVNPHCSTVSSLNAVMFCANQKCL